MLDWALDRRSPTTRAICVGLWGGGILGGALALFAGVLWVVDVRTSTLHQVIACSVGSTASFALVLGVSQLRGVKRFQWNWPSVASVLAGLAVLLLVACGGGGDDVADAAGPGGQQPAQIVLDSTASSTHSTTTPTDRIVAELVSPQYSLGAAGRAEVCADVTWNQQLRRAAALELRTVLAGAGAESEALSASAAGAVGQNVLVFRRCQSFDHAGDAGLTAARIALDMRSSGALIPMQGYTVTVHWTAAVTRP